MRNKRSPTYAVVIALTMALLGTACGDQTRDAVEEAMEEVAADAREKLYEEPISFSPKGVDGTAELMPNGDLLIDGKPVPLDDTQQEAALAYREKFLALADAGILVGQQGAALGGEAAALALSAVFGGEDAEEAERKIEAEAKKIEKAAQALCRNARALEVEQERFAEIVPEFAPYAKEIDIDVDCEDADDD
ncbi:MAG: hypothetical protein AAF756_01195 [Pseudomonadota bacterium]